MKEMTVTKQKEFSAKVRAAIKARDESCLFCRRNIYPAAGSHKIETSIPEIAHIVNRSQGGLGVEKNGILLCHYHHNMMDNGYQGRGQEMKEACIEYMADYYGSWDAAEVTYQKGETHGKTTVQ